VLNVSLKPIVWHDLILNNNSYLGGSKFSFLNIEHDFKQEIDWDYEGYGKLWSFNLNYFDFLNQSNIEIEDGLKLINDYISKDAFLNDGKASYPISLRGINWIKFVSKHKINNSAIDQALYTHYQILFHNLEYHLLGNHLLENGFSLLFGAYYYKDEILYKKAVIILKTELKEQVLNDGGHFELSPMYHQIMLFRVLDCVQLVRLNAWKNDDLLQFLEDIASTMLCWLEQVTFENGDIPMTNDSSYGIAPCSKELLGYGKHLGLSVKELKLYDSGYRMLKNTNFELFVDVGNVGASYQPAHVHSDTFNFVLHSRGMPIIVDRGVTTYEKNVSRQKERSTVSHNTVQIATSEQTDVWGGFRVAERARITSLLETKNTIEATHDGYKKLGFIHKRVFYWNTEGIIIQDDISKSTNNTSKAFFHFHADIEEPTILKNTVFLKKENIRLEFEGSIDISLTTYQLSEGFNKSKAAFKIIVTFDTYLKTKISL
jgi:hypothetical protein